MSSETLTIPTGYIKRFHLNKWRERYAVIEDNKFLCVYNDDTKKGLVNKIDLVSARIRLVDETNEFEVDTPSKKYFFQCDAITDANHWLKYLLYIKTISQTRARSSISDEDNTDTNTELKLDTHTDTDTEMQKAAMQIYNVVLTPKREPKNGFKTFSANNFSPNNKRSKTLFTHTHNANEHKSNKFSFSQTPTNNTRTNAQFPETDAPHTRQRSHATHQSRSPNTPSVIRQSQSPFAKTRLRHSYRSTSSVLNLNAIDRIDLALSEYYSFFPNTQYRNETKNCKFGKFGLFCMEQYDGDNEEIKSELETNYVTPEDCGLVSFDEDDNGLNHFPLEFHIQNTQKRDAQIFAVLKHCYIYGKAPKPLLSFAKDHFNYVLEPFQKKCVIHMRPKTHFMRLTQSGLTLNLTSSNNEICIDALNPELRELIGIAMHADNNIFKYDLASLLIDSYHRYCIVREVIFGIGNVDSVFCDDMFAVMASTQPLFAQKLLAFCESEEYDSDAVIDGDILTQFANDSIKESARNVFEQQCHHEILKRHQQMQYQIYGQVYWKERSNNKGEKRRKVVSNVTSELQTAFNVLGGKSKAKGRILLINGKVIASDANTSDLKQIAVDDYKNILFRFMSSNGFYWSLVKKKDLSFFNKAFACYDKEICGPLTLSGMHKINDNIFVFWVYIWCMSKVVKTYMQSGNITIPLQIDLVIIPNNTQWNVSIAERFQIHEQSYKHELCDPNDILNINQTLENVLTKCNNDIKVDNEMETNGDRIVIIVDRRCRDEYNKDNKAEMRDQIFGYKPPNKYAQIDEAHEILNAVWNTSKFLIPPPTDYKHEELSGAQSNADLFVLSYLIRKKSQFIHLFDQDEVGDDIYEDDSDNIQDLESIVSDESHSRSTHLTLRTKTDITIRKFESKVAQGFAVVLRRHKELTTLMLVAVFGKVADSMKDAGVRVDSKELKELQTIQSFIMKLLMNRKRDSTANTFLFYNTGYIRFEPLDLVRILPKFFNLQRIARFNEMLSVFRRFHDKLWELDDLIWMEYKALYLQSANAKNQQISMERLGTDHKDREVLRKYCKWHKIKGANTKTQFGSLKKQTSILKIYNIMKIRSQQSLDLFRTVKKDKHQCTISLSMDLREFVQFKTDSKGVVVHKIERNEYGSLFKETGVKHGWYCHEINELDVKTNMDQFNTILDKILDLKMTYKVKFIRMKHRKSSNVKNRHKRADSNLRPSQLLRKKRDSTQTTHNTGNIYHASATTNKAPTLKHIFSMPRIDIISESKTQTEEASMLVIDEFEIKKGQCPKCKFPRTNAKINRIHCKQCGMVWCFRCLQKWKSISMTDMMRCGNANCLSSK